MDTFPPFLLPALATLCAALTVWAFARLLAAAPRFNAPDVLAYAYGTSSAPVAAVPVGSHLHRVRLAFGLLGLNVSGKEQLAVWSARVLLGLVFAAGLLLLGLPWLAVLGAFGLGMLAAGGPLLEFAWQQQRLRLERDLPAFLGSLAVAVQLTPSATQAARDALETLDEKSPLRLWLAQALTRLELEGRAVSDALQDEAQSLSPALGVLMFQLRRLNDTGGAGYANAFNLTADTLGAVLETRADAEAKAGKARGTVFVVLFLMLGLLAYLLRLPDFRGGLQDTTVQLVYLGAAGFVAVGIQAMNTMVQEAMA